MSSWYSIEVLDGSSSAALWAMGHGDRLVESALACKADDWSWHQHSWGVVFEVSLDSDAVWEAFGQMTGVRAALDAVPDPFTGLIVYRGRGGSAGAPEPRRPRPMAGSGSAALPLPWDLGLDDLVASQPLSALSAPIAVGTSARR